MGTIRGALDEIAREMRKVAGIKHAPANPPNSMDAYPFVVVRLSAGSYRQTHASGGNLQGLHDVQIEVHVSPYDQVLAYRVLVDLADLIPKQLVNARNDGDFSHVITWEDVETGGITYVVQQMNYAGVDTHAIVYTVPAVKVEVSLA